MFMRTLFAAAVVSATFTPALAQEDLDDVGTEPAPDEATGPDKGKKPSKAEKAAREPLQIGGRVFARGVVQSVDSGSWLGELKLDSARIGASYRWKDRMRVKAVAELAGTPEVKDAFVDVQAAPGLDVRAGYFKVPISVIENASTWTLPTIDRGAVAEVLADGLGLTGRRDGVMVDWTPPSRTAKVIVMVSQSVAVTGQDPARPLEDGGGVAVTVRAEYEPCDCVRLGVHGSNREVNYISDVRRYWAGGVDAEVDLEPIGKGLRLWSDVIVGQGHFGAITLDKPVTGFVAAQVAAGWRLGGAKKNKPYVEPYLLGGYVNPNWELRRDDVTDLIVGVAGGRWERWRAQAQVSVVNVKAQRPSGLDGVGRDINDAITGTLQLGAAF